MARLGSLDYVMLFAPDVAALAAFYRDVLDAPLIEEAYPHWARLRLANIDLGIHAAGPDRGARARPDPSSAARRGYPEARTGAPGRRR